MATLREAKIGETVTVKRIHGEGALKRRIMDMGITKGVQIYVRKVAPLRSSAAHWDEPYLNPKSRASLNSCRRGSLCRHR